MNYQLVYTTRAKNDLRAATEYIAQQVPENAEQWFNGFVAAIAKLRRNPLVYGLAPENDRVSDEIRQLRRSADENLPIQPRAVHGLFPRSGISPAVYGGVAALPNNNSRARFTGLFAADAE